MLQYEGSSFCYELHSVDAHFTLQFTLTEPGVPYNVTVRASTAVGIGEPVSIFVFTEQQGDMIGLILCTRDNIIWCAQFVPMFAWLKHAYGMVIIMLVAIRN